MPHMGGSLDRHRRLHPTQDVHNALEVETRSFPNSFENPEIAARGHNQRHKDIFRRIFLRAEPSFTGHRKEAPYDLSVWLPFSIADGQG
jgi:hypothetical protein